MLLEEFKTLKENVEQFVIDTGLFYFNAPADSKELASTAHGYEEHGFMDLLHQYKDDFEKRSEKDADEALDLAKSAYSEFKTRKEEYEAFITDHADDHDTSILFELYKEITEALQFFTTFVYHDFAGKLIEPDDVDYYDQEKQNAEVKAAGGGSRAWGDDPHDDSDTADSYEMEFEESKKK